MLPYVSTDDNCGGGYDFILMAETVYSVSSLQTLYNLIKKVFFCSLTRAKLYFYVESWHCKFDYVYLSVLMSCF